MLTSPGPCVIIAWQATAALARVRGPEDDVESEIETIADAFAQEMASGEPSWHEFTTGPMLRRSATGVMLQLLQQLCGMSAFVHACMHVSMGIRMHRHTHAWAYACTHACYSSSSTCAG